MDYIFYDTSALLAMYNLPEEEGIPYISEIVFKELENVKSSNLKDRHLKARARSVIKRFIEDEIEYKSNLVPYTNIEATLKQNGSIMMLNNDSLILCEALCLAKNNNVIFYTSDGSLYNIAKHYINDKFDAIYVPPNESRDDLWSGWGKYFPNEKEMSLLYTDKKMNVLGASVNEFCEIFEGDNLKDVEFWNGEEYRNLNYKTFRSKLDEKIAPRNLEQKMLFDLLQNKEIPVKLCLGKFGSGKSMLMLAHALNLIEMGEYDKLVFVRNNIEVKDAGEIGILPGEMEEKIAPYIRPIADHIGEIALEDYMAQGVIEAVPLGFIRGRDIKNAIIFIDEAENLTRQHIQLLLGRCGKNSQIWIAGDLKQTDSITFERNSGIISLIEKLKGNKNFGMVKLLRSERSEVANLADLLD